MHTKLYYAFYGFWEIKARHPEAEIYYPTKLEPQKIESNPALIDREKFFNNLTLSKLKPTGDFKKKQFKAPAS